MSYSSKVKKGERFAALVRRAGKLPVSMLAAAEPLELAEKAEAQPTMSGTSDPIARRVAELMIGALPPGRSAKDADRINRVAVQLHELRVLSQQVGQRQRGHG